MKHYFLILVLASVALSFGVATRVSAHQPRYVKDDQLVVIKRPDISQTFYGELKGQPAYYMIDLKEAQSLSFQILVPDLPDIQKDKIITVDYAPDFGQAAASFVNIDPDPAAWKKFYEEYAGDNYWQGQEAKKAGDAGYYIVKISSPENVGKYVLMVGEKEEFPPLEIAKALITIPQLKTKFFNKPIWQSFQGKIGKYAGLSLLVLAIFGFLFRRFHRVYR